MLAVVVDGAYVITCSSIDIKSGGVDAGFEAIVSVDDWSVGQIIPRSVDYLRVYMGHDEYQMENCYVTESNAEVEECAEMHFQATSFEHI